VTVQLVTTGACWEDVYSFPPAAKNAPDQLNDKAD
jgi:hypothetical protein